MDTIVTQNGDTAQVFALIALIVFAIYAVLGVVRQSVETALLGAGLAFVSAAVLFLA